MISLLIGLYLLGGILFVLLRKEEFEQSCLMSGAESDQDWLICYLIAIAVWLPALIEERAMR